MIRIGLIGASRIAQEAIIAPARDIPEVSVDVIAASDLDRAHAYAELHRIPQALGSYDALIALEDIDLIYIGLPPHAHKEWAIKAMESGKHVLCEKPLALSLQDADAMTTCAMQNDRSLIEAFHYRFHPLFIRTMDLVRNKALGALKSAHGKFNVPVTFTNREFRYQPEMGGGALMDLGCYPIHWLRSIFGTTPKVMGSEVTLARYGVDVATRADLQFDNGATATIECSMDESLPNTLDATLVVKGVDGVLNVSNPLQPELGSRLTLDSKSTRLDEQYEGSTFPYQLRYVTQQLRANAPALTGGVDAVANMRVIEDIYKKAGHKTHPGI
ncbi:MAG: Gfo/Idh/MocA family oxidoreductase [Pseudomonadota bacterium]